MKAFLKRRGLAAAAAIGLCLSSVAPLRAEVPNVGTAIELNQIAYTTAAGSISSVDSYTGTGTVTTAGNTVTGTGTTFTTQAAIGDRIIIRGVDRMITGVGSDTTITVNNIYNPITVAGVGFQIRKAGPGTITRNNYNVTGVGTTFNTPGAGQIKPGETIRFYNGDSPIERTVQSVTSDTALVLDDDGGGNVGPGASYLIPTRVTGTGTAFTTDFTVGDRINWGAGEANVIEIVDNTTLRVSNIGVTLNAGNLLKNPSQDEHAVATYNPVDDEILVISVRTARATSATGPADLGGPAPTPVPGSLTTVVEKGRRDQVRGSILDAKTLAVKAADILVIEQTQPHVANTNVRADHQTLNSIAAAYHPGLGRYIVVAGGQTDSSGRAYANARDFGEVHVQKITTGASAAQDGATVVFDYDAYSSPSIGTNGDESGDRTLEDPNGVAVGVSPDNGNILILTTTHGSGYGENIMGAIMLNSSLAPQNTADKVTRCVAYLTGGGRSPHPSVTPNLPRHFTLVGLDDRKVGLRGVDDEDPEITWDAQNGGFVCTWHHLQFYDAAGAHLLNNIINMRFIDDQLSGNALVMGGDQYGPGTITYINNTSTTGTGTTFGTDVVVGSELAVVGGGPPRLVGAVNSATSLTMTQAWPNNTTGQAKNPLATNERYLTWNRAQYPVSVSPQSGPVDTGDIGVNNNNDPDLFPSFALNNLDHRDGNVVANPFNPAFNERFAMVYRRDRSGFFDAATGDEEGGTDVDEGLGVQFFGIGAGPTYSPLLGPTIDVILPQDIGHAGLGTISGTGTTITGSGTAFTSELKVGDNISARVAARTSAQNFNITAIASDTSLTVTPAIGLGGIDPGTVYSIAPVRRLGLLNSVGPQNGSGTIVSSGTTVTGTGSNFTGQTAVGQTISADGQTRTITAINSGTSLTVDSAFSPDVIGAGSGATYSFQDLTVTITGAATTGQMTVGSRIRLHDNSQARTVTAILGAGSFKVDSAYNPPAINRGWTVSATPQVRRPQIVADTVNQRFMIIYLDDTVNEIRAIYMDPDGNIDTDTPGNGVNIRTGATGDLFPDRVDLDLVYPGCEYVMAICRQSSPTTGRQRPMAIPVGTLNGTCTPPALGNRDWQVFE